MQRAPLTPFVKFSTSQHKHLMLKVPCFLTKLSHKMPPFISNKIVDVHFTIKMLVGFFYVE
jgi:hypothetical protein